MTVGAPTAGIVLGPQREAMLRAGAKLERGDVMMELLPLPPDSELRAAREEMAVREAELNVARARAERAGQLFDGRSGVRSRSNRRKRIWCAPKLRTRRAVPASAAAGRRRERADADHPSQSAAGRTGRAARGLRAARPGGCAAFRRARAGAPLGARAGVLVGSNATMPSAGHRNASRLLVRAGGRVSAAGRRSTERERPRSIDLFYELDNSDGAFRAGQRVQVSVGLRESGEHLVVPWSAVLQDIHGGSWVYVQTRAPRLRTDAHRRCSRSRATWPCSRGTRARHARS